MSDACLKFSAGVDIVIFEIPEGWRDPYAYNKIVLETRSLFFNTEHKYGQVFSDCLGAGHYNANGAHEIADVLFEHIEQNNYFNHANNLEIYQGLIPKDISPINQFGTPRNSANNIIPPEYEEDLNSYRRMLSQIQTQVLGRAGSIVMNCNPFTLGHRYLIEYAASRVEHLYIFAVEEDKSIFPFADRIELIKAGTADLANVTVLPSGKFIISSLTFVDYFNKAELQDQAIDPTMDIELFAKEIAPTMNITVRFAGEEPIDMVTKQYNDTMKRILPQYGIEFVEIGRKESDGQVISASRVRKFLETRDFDAIARIVPKTTLDYLKKKY